MLSSDNLGCPISVSFIIPHKGRVDLLIETIKSVLQLDSDHLSIEIIIATKNKILDLSPIDKINQYVKITIISCPEENTISMQRNIGAKMSSGAYLSFIDADIWLSKNWLIQVMKELTADLGRILISSIQDCEEGAGDVEKIRVLISGISADREVEFLPSANLFLTRDAFNSIGGFPEKIETCEDYYFTNNLSKKGRLFLTSKATFIHLGEDKSHLELFKKEIWRSQSNLKSIKNRKLTLREIPSIVVPLWQAFFALIILSSLFRVNGVFFLTASFLFILPTIIYSFRLYRLVDEKLYFLKIFKFFFTYQIARIVGTITGIFCRI